MLVRREQGVLVLPVCEAFHLENLSSGTQG